jgi:hypothetical protein
MRTACVPFDNRNKHLPSKSIELYHQPKLSVKTALKQPVYVLNKLFTGVSSRFRTWKARFTDAQNFLFYDSVCNDSQGTPHLSWLRHCATTLKVAGLIRDKFIGFFNLPNPSSGAMVMKSIRRLTEMIARNSPGVMAAGT